VDVNLFKIRRRFKALLRFDGGRFVPGLVKFKVNVSLAPRLGELNVIVVVD